MFEEQEALPTLIYLNRKRKQTLIIQSVEDKNKSKARERQGGKSQIQENKKQNEKQKEILAERMPPPRVQQFDARFKAMNEKTKDQTEKNKTQKTDKFKEVQNSKSLINEILYKINAKNISEQLYPVTNQTIEQLKWILEQQITQLKNQAQRKQHSLHSNPNNQHLKKQLQALKKSIDRSMTIKQLYNEKINLRNKINTLESSIINLRQENMNLKIKISRGVQKIQNHMHNLPCEKQKQLKIELTKCMNDYRIQKQMRQKLQSNISEIVLNFKRLYQEAETARLIVTRKLTELQTKQKQLLIAIKEAEKVEANKDKQQKNQVDSNSLKLSLQTRVRKQTIQDARNNAIVGQLNKRTPQKRPIVPQNAPTDRTKHKEKQQLQFSLQQQIKRMRANQSTIVTLQRR